MVWKTETEDNQHKWCAEVDGLESWTTDRGDFHRSWHAYDSCEKQVLPDTVVELWKINMAPLPPSLPADVPHHYIYILLFTTLPSSGT